MQAFRPNPIVRDALSETLENFRFDIRHLGLFRSTPPHPAKTTVGVSYKLVFLFHGQVRFESAALRFLLAPGDVLIVPPFVRYTASGEGEQPMEYGYAYFDFADPAMETDFATLFACSAPVCLPGVLDEFHRQAAHHLIDQLDPQAPGAHLTAHLILEHLMLGMLRCQLNAAPELERALADPSAQLVHRCIDALRRMEPADFTVNRLCEEVHVSQSYLYKCFQKAMNCSPNRFLILYRLKLAERELCRSSASIQQLAEQYGYTSAAAFSHVFRQYFAVSPAAWRKGQRSAIEKKS